MSEANIGAEAIADELLRERKRQVVVEGCTRRKDDCYVEGELAQAALCYVMNSIIWAQLLARGMSRSAIAEKNAAASVPKTWPWHRHFWKPREQRENLVRAGALIIAEIERLDRATARTQSAAAEPGAAADAPHNHYEYFRDEQGRKQRRKVPTGGVAP